MGYRGKTKVDTPLFTEKPEIGIVKLFSQINDYGHRGTKSADNAFLDKVCCVCFSDLDQGLCFHPPGKVIYGYYSVLGLARRSGKWPDQV